MDPRSTDRGRLIVRLRESVRAVAAYLHAGPATRLRRSALNQGRTTMNSILHRAGSAALLSLTATLAFSQSATPKEVPASSIVPEAKEARESIALVGLPKEHIVSGRQLHDSYFVGAEALVFEPGAELVFSEKALQKRNNLIIAATRMVMRDPNRPGRISWARGEGPSGAGPASGQAPSGPDGNGDGASGSPGSPGATGITGFSGRNAPNLTIFLTRIEGAPPSVDMVGQAGGKGGAGQRGGDGGSGQKGSPASASAFDCKSGAGHGGNGGTGGSGGAGGVGGAGGTGGTVTLVSMQGAFPALLQLIRVDVGGGSGGDGGDPGNGGAGGRGGSQGEKALPYCKDEPSRRGKDAPAGQKGSPGPTGARGPQGDLFFTSLQQDAFKHLFGAL